MLTAVGSAGAELFSAAAREDDRGRIRDGDYPELSQPHWTDASSDQFWTDGCSVRVVRECRRKRVNKLPPPVSWMIVE